MATATMPSEAHEPQLNELANLTQMMRSHQDHITKLGEKRLRVIKQLRQDGVPVRAMAGRMQVSEQQVFSLLKKDRERGS